MMAQRPNVDARWREVFERPVGEASGLWRRCGCECRMRETRRGSEAWIARRRRREGSILGKEEVSWSSGHDCWVRGTHRDRISTSLLDLHRKHAEKQRQKRRCLAFRVVLMVGRWIWLVLAGCWALGWFLVEAQPPVQTTNVSPPNPHVTEIRWGLRHEEHHPVQSDCV